MTSVLTYASPRMETPDTWQPSDQLIKLAVHPSGDVGHHSPRARSAGRLYHLNDVTNNRAGSRQAVGSETALNGARR
jgi:hypothetical protein